MEVFNPLKNDRLNLSLSGASNSDENEKSKFMSRSRNTVHLVYQHEVAPRTLLR